MRNPAVANKTIIPLSSVTQSKSVLLRARDRPGRLQANLCLGIGLWAQCIAFAPSNIILSIGSDNAGVCQDPPQLHVQLQLILMVVMRFLIIFSVYLRVSKLTIHFVNTHLVK